MVLCIIKLYIHLKIFYAKIFSKAGLVFFIVEFSELQRKAFFLLQLKYQMHLGIQIWTCIIANLQFSKKLKFVKKIHFVGLELMKSDVQDFQKYSSYIFSSRTMNQRCISTFFTIQVIF